jgi:D-arabinose 1-dehydrogenase-like Zn-dependent alcohol dehydrogenase
MTSPDPSPAFSTERVTLVEYGWDRALAYTRGSDSPVVRDDHVVVAVEACGVCHRDLLEREGRFPFLRLPITPGHEAVGRVVEVGPRVSGLVRGTRVATLHRDRCGSCAACRSGQSSLCPNASWVFGILADGGYASLLSGPESAFYPLPSELPAEQAAALHCTFGTAFRDLSVLGRLVAGERLLVTGANGGVGSAAVALGVRLGAEVFAVVRDARHRTFVEGLGAREVIVDPGGSFHKKLGDIDLALDTVGSPTFNSALRTLRLGGRMVTVGNIAPDRVPLNLGYVITRGLTVIGGSGATPEDMQALLALRVTKPFQVPIHATLPLAEADQAQRLVRAGGLHGRIVLVPEPGGEAC